MTHYCWTYGYNDSHDSTTCTYPAISHCHKATHANRMGENVRNQHRYQNSWPIGIDSVVHNLNNNYMHNLFSLPKLTSFILDSGTTSHFSTSSQLNGSEVPFTSVTATLSNNKHISSSHRMNLNLNLPSKAANCYILPQLHVSLLSLGQFCDANCTAVFQNDTAYVLKNNDWVKNLILSAIKDSHLILSANRNNQSYLCTIDKLPPNQSLSSFPISTIPSSSTKFVNIIQQQHISYIINNLYQLRSTYEKIHYLYTACGCPVKSTFLKAMRNRNFIG